MHPHLFHGSADVFYVASSSTYASGLCDDIKWKRSTVKINYISMINYLTIRTCLRFAGFIIIIIKELICALKDAIKLTLIFSDT